MAETILSVVGSQTTAGASEETLLLSLNGAAATATLSVAAGTVLKIGTVAVTCVTAQGIFDLQQANDGSTFFTIGYFEHNGASSSTAVYNVNTGWIVDGDAGSNVVIRMRVTTPGGAAAVSAVIRSYTES